MAGPVRWNVAGVPKMEFMTRRESWMCRAAVVCGFLVVVVACAVLLQQCQDAHAHPVQNPTVQKIESFPNFSLVVLDLLDSSRPTLPERPTYDFALSIKSWSQRTRSRVLWQTRPNPSSVRVAIDQSWRITNTSGEFVVRAFLVPFPIGFAARDTMVRNFYRDDTQCRRCIWPQRTNHTKISSGTCEDHGLRPITHFSACAVAMQGIVVSGSVAVTQKAGRPVGCYLFKDRHPWFGTNGRDPGNASSSRQALCVSAPACSAWRPCHSQQEVAPPPADYFILSNLPMQQTGVEQSWPHHTYGSPFYVIPYVGSVPDLSPISSMDITEPGLDTKTSLLNVYPLTLERSFAEGTWLILPPDPAARQNVRLRLSLHKRCLGSCRGDEARRVVLDAQPGGATHFHANSFPGARLEVCFDEHIIVEKVSMTWTNALAEMFAFASALRTAIFFLFPVSVFVPMYFRWGRWRHVFRTRLGSLSSRTAEFEKAGASAGVSGSAGNNEERTPASAIVEALILDIPSALGTSSSWAKRSPRVAAGPSLSPRLAPSASPLA